MKIRLSKKLLALVTSCAVAFTALASVVFVSADADTSLIAGKIATTVVASPDKPAAFGLTVFGDSKGAGLLTDGDTDTTVNVCNQYSVNGNTDTGYVSTMTGELFDLGGEYDISGVAVYADATTVSNVKVYVGEHEGDLAYYGNLASTVTALNVLHSFTAAKTGRYILFMFTATDTEEQIAKVAELKVFGTESATTVGDGSDNRLLANTMPTTFMKGATEDALATVSGYASDTGYQNAFVGFTDGNVSDAPGSANASWAGRAWTGTRYVEIGYTLDQAYTFNRVSYNTIWGQSPRQWKVYISNDVTKLTDPSKLAYASDAHEDVLQFNASGVFSEIKTGKYITFVVDNGDQGEDATNVGEVQAFGAESAASINPTPYLTADTNLIAGKIATTVVSTPDKPAAFGLTVFGDHKGAGVLTDGDTTETVNVCNQYSVNGNTDTGYVPTLTGEMYDLGTVYNISGVSIFADATTISNVKVYVGNHEGDLAYYGNLASTITTFNATQSFASAKAGRYILFMFSATDTAEQISKVAELKVFATESSATVGDGSDNRLLNLSAPTTFMKGGTEDTLATVAGYESDSGYAIAFAGFTNGNVYGHNNPNDHGYDTSEPGSDVASWDGRAWTGTRFVEIGYTLNQAYTFNRASYNTIYGQASRQWKVYISNDASNLTDPSNLAYASDAREDALQLNASGVFSEAKTGKYITFVVDNGDQGEDATNVAEIQAFGAESADSINPQPFAPAPDNTDTDTDTGNTDANTNNSGTNNVGNSETRSPKTGDNSVLPFVALAIIASAGGMLAVKRKKYEVIGISRGGNATDCCHRGFFHR